MEVYHGSIKTTNRTGQFEFKKYREITCAMTNSIANLYANQYKKDHWIHTLIRSKFQIHLQHARSISRSDGPNRSPLSWGQPRVAEKNKPGGCQPYRSWLQFNHPNLWATQESSASSWTIQWEGTDNWPTIVMNKPIWSDSKNQNPTAFLPTLTRGVYWTPSTACSVLFGKAMAFWPLRC